MIKPLRFGVQSVHMLACIGFGYVIKAGMDGGRLALLPWFLLCAALMAGCGIPLGRWVRSAPDGGVRA